jgi:nucleoid-associated protein EbfC
VFKELGMLSSLLGNKGKIQDRMAQFQGEVAKVVATGSAGNGAVTVKVSGKFEVLAVVLGELASSLPKAQLEDLITNAVNAGLADAKVQVADLTKKMADDLGLPPGMLGGGGLPGLG